MKRLSRALDFYEKTFGTIALMLMLAMVSYQIIARFFLGSSLRWSEEFARYLMLYLSFLGIGAGIKYHKHVGVEILDGVLPAAPRRIMKLVVALLTLAIMAFFVYVTAQATFRIMRSGQKSPAGHIPMWIPYGTIPLGFAGGILRQLEEIVKIIKTPAGQLDAVEREEASEIDEV